MNHRDNGGCAPIHLAFKGIFKDDHFQSDAECLQYCKEMVLRGHNADVNLPDTTGKLSTNILLGNIGRLGRRLSRLEAEFVSHSSLKSTGRGRGGREVRCHISHYSINIILLL